jgi:hypothetical protein
MMRRAGHALLFGFLLSFISSASAESCKTIGGCVGTERIIHVPQKQLDSAVVFQNPGLPQPDSVEVIQTDVALLRASTFSGPYLDELRGVLAKGDETDAELLAEFGNALDAGNKVLVLSYRTFPSLGPMAGELFAVVYVMSE